MVDLSAGFDVELESIVPDAGPETKTYADEQHLVVWHYDDRVTVFEKKEYWEEYRYTGRTGTVGGRLMPLPSGGSGTGGDLDYYYAVYPHSEWNGFDSNGHMLLTLPREQSYDEFSFGRGANVMVSASADNNFKFKNIGGYLVFKLYGEGVSVSSVRLSGKNGQELTGDLDVIVAPGAEPVVTMSTARYAVKYDEAVLVCDPPVDLGATKDDYKEFWFVLPPMTLNGYSIEVTTSDGKVWTKSTDNNKTITRNHYSPISAMEVIPESVTPEPAFYALTGLPKVPYISNTYNLAVKWSDFNLNVLVPLGADNNEFTSTYQFEGVYVFANVLLDDGVTVKKQLIPTTVSSQGSFQSVSFQEYNKANNRYETKNWGSARYKNDGSSSPFEWNVVPLEMGENTTRSIYFKFVKGDLEVYFEMRAEVAARAQMHFGENKINNVWFSDIDNEASNTVRINVPVPNVNPPTYVMDFKMDLCKFFIGNKPALALDEASDPIYSTIYNDSSAPGYADLHIQNSVFRFSENQPAITDSDGLTWLLFTKNWEDETGKDFTKLYCAQYTTSSSGQRYMRTKTLSNGTVVPLISEEYLVATITNTSSGCEIEYQPTEIAKYLLNLWSYSSTDQNSMLYANITVKNSYGSGGIETEDANFHVRFIRPIDIYLSTQSITESPFSDEYNLEIAKFITGIMDWNKLNVITKEYVSGAWTGYYVPNIIKTINIYSFYGFMEIRIDLDNAMRNNWNPSNPNAWGRLSAVSPSQSIRFGSVDSYGNFIESSSSSPYHIDMVDFSSLRTYRLSFRDYETGSESFTIIVPAEIEYSWGTFSVNLTISVSGS